MKRRSTLLLILVLSLCFVLVFSSCGDFSSTDTNTNTETSTKAEKPDKDDEDEAVDSSTEENTESDNNFESESDTDASTSIESGTDTEVESDTNMDSETNTETETSTDTETDVDEPEHVHTEEIISAIAPSCTEAGLTEGKKCSVCGDILVQQKVIDALGHTEEIIPAIKPTCTTNGFGEGVKCSTCGEILVARKELFAGGHKPEVVKGKAPTCTQAGLTDGEKCSECGEILVGQEIIAAQHTYKNSYICSLCSYVSAIESIGLEFTLNTATDTYYVSGIGSCTDTDIVIPYTYEGKAVTSIGNSAFYCYRSLTSVTIGDSVTSIGERAFLGCDKLVEVYNLSGLNINAGSYDNGYIGYDAKVVHTSLDEESILETIDDYIFMTWRDKYYLMGYVGDETELTLPNDYNGNNYEIYQYAFYSRNDITIVTIPDGVTSIGERAFMLCTDLTSIAIPNSVTSIGESAFSHCTNLTSITVDKNNTAYKSIDGNLYSYDEKTLVQYAIGKQDISFIIPNSVTIIGFNAFCSCNSLTSVTIPNSVTNIGYYAFQNCKNLTNVTIDNAPAMIAAFAFSGCSSLASITIPDSVISIDYNVFENCDNLTSVTINGVTRIGFEAFYNCTSIKSVHINDIASWCNIKFATHDANPLSSGANLYINGELVTDLVIPDTVTEIKAYAFYNCKSLISITIPDSVTSIGDRAFYGCSKLTYNEYDNAYYLGNKDNPYVVLIKAKDKSITSCTINENTKFIYAYAFSGCTSLTSITIGEGVTSIGKYAFSNCTSLTSITFEDADGWYVTYTADAASGTSLTLTNASTNATYLKDTYDSYYWYKK